MCLYSSTGKKVAEEDIPCFKIMIESRGRYYTPYKARRVFGGVVRGRRKMRARGNGCVIEKPADYFTGYTRYCVGCGYIHTFSKESYANGRRYCFDECDTVLFRCVIPAGTRYWVSEDGMEYASKYLRFVEIVG